jgi:peptide deformylase
MTKKVKFVKGEMYEYEVYPLVDEYSPVLKTKCDPFRFESDEMGAKSAIDPKYFAISMIETMRTKGGVGLAANQVGFPYRVFVMGAEGVGYAFFNPVILEFSGTEKFEEGCLTFPGLFLPITRPATVKVGYQDMYGEAKEAEFSGLSARIILHEHDHLDGIVFTTKVSPIIYDRQKRKVKKNLKLLAIQKENNIKKDLIDQAIQNLGLAERKKLDPDKAGAPDTGILKISNLI